MEYTAASLKALHLSVFTGDCTSDTNLFLNKCINVERLALVLGSEHKIRFDLSALTKLKYLKLNCADNDDVLLLLKEIGSRLISLDITEPVVYDDGRLVQMVTSCPNLRFIAISYSSSDVLNLLQERNISVRYKQY
jgi:hypothetical protein